MNFSSFFFFNKFFLEIFTLFLYYIVLIASNELSIKTILSINFSQNFYFVNNQYIYKATKIRGEILGGNLSLILI